MGLCLNDKQKKLLGSIPYLSASPASWDLLGKVQSAEALEAIVTSLVSKWFQRHAKSDFKESTGGYRTTPSNMHRWMAHLLLTTTVNIATGSRVVAFAAEGAAILPFRASRDLFMNFELLLKDNFAAINVGPPFPATSQLNFTKR